MGINVRIITVPFSPVKEVFQDEVLSAFLVNKQVRSLKPHFFQYDGNPYWTVLVEYEPILATAETRPVTEELNDEQQVLFRRLRTWRKERADQNGTPVFILATNAQLVKIAIHQPASLEALRQIQGFGKKKVDQYGQELIELIKAFSSKKPSTPKNTNDKDEILPENKKSDTGGKV